MTLVTHMSEAFERQPAMVVRKCQPTAGAEHSTHQDAHEIMTWPPSDCIFTVSFCKGNIFAAAHISISSPHTS
jgi:hypothetical protein